MAPTYSLVLFDLDGTLVDPAGAITDGIGAALRSHGFEVPDEETLHAMVGPALVQSLTAVAGVPADAVRDVVATYRAGYLSTGLQQSRPYPGVIECVRALADDGAVVAVATQKPEWLAEELLTVQGMRHLFASVHGSPRDESRTIGGKTPIIRAALEAHPHAAGRAVMIGDRRHDVEGALANGIACIGVDWGFAAPGELEGAGALAVVHSAGELSTLIQGNP
ncbi:HAD hydrolase-like protein [Arthrobacter echini]|uniref:HAD hydrolase-like protein n=1 Tax=Arthrobacter echini TaxID=1529066 RepID=UPI0021CD0D57|nr:HAD hydrolase-like protein [Arthrobacter echini]